MNINKLIEKGEDAHKKRNYDYAISIFMEAVNFAPNSRRAREGLRTAQLKKREPSYPNGLAIAIFGMGPRIGMFFSGLSKKSNPEGYMMACERYLCLDPKNNKVNMALGDAAMRAGHLDASILAFETAADNNPEDVTALKKLAALYHKTGELEKAHETYSLVVDLDPKDQEAIKARKNVAAESSLKDTGFETAKSSQDLVKDKGALARLEQETRIFQTSTDLESQVAHLEGRIKDDPDNPDLFQDLAEVLVKQKNWGAALATMDKAIAAKPGDMSIEFAKGDIEINRIEEEILELSRAGKQDEADGRQSALDETRTTEFRKRVKAYPTDLKLRFALGDLLFKQGALDEAIGEFQQTVRDPKYKSESQLQLGRAFATKGQHDMAIRQLTQAMEGQAGMNERIKEILYTLGDIYAQKGDAAAAKAEFAKIYEVDIGFRDVVDRLSELDSSSSEGKLPVSD